MILTADLHLTDSSEDAYRWVIFKELRRIAAETHDTEIVILGDLTDRKDRHSSELVNRLIQELSALADKNDITILMGNHDRPINGRPFWQFLDRINSRSLRFVTKPLDRAGGSELYLPYAANPAEEWAQVKLSGRKVIFIHQTVTGAIGNNGHELENKKMVSFPRGVRVYAGDIHVPQKVGPVTYVGAPYPIKFGDDYPCRILSLDSRYGIAQEHLLTPPAKRILRISSLEELGRITINPSDKLRVFYSLPIAHLESWPDIKTKIENWSDSVWASLVSVEPTIVGRAADAGSTPDEPQTERFDALTSEGILRAFAEAEGVSDSMLNYALALTKKLAGAV